MKQITILRRQEIGVLPQMGIGVNASKQKPYVTFPSGLVGSFITSVHPLCGGHGVLRLAARRGIGAELCWLAAEVTICFFLAGRGVAPA